MKALFAACMSGLLVMSIEMTASRILAPYIGASIEVWTAIIVCIIGSLSLGNYIGGKLADSQAGAGALSRVFIAVAVCALVTAVLQHFLLSSLSGFGWDIRISALILALILFGPAAVCLGAVAPLALKLHARTLGDLGQKSGAIIAVSSLGSIFGTMLTGFVLIAFMSYPQILLLIAGLATLSALLIQPGLKCLPLALFTVLGGLFLNLRDGWQQIGNERLINVDTKYARYQIVDTIAPVSKRPVRKLTNGPCGVQSVVFTDRPSYTTRSDRFSALEHRLAAGTDEFAHDSHGLFRLWEHFTAKRGKLRALMLGGGAFVYPSAFLESHPLAELDVVEIDPVLPVVARQYFSLGPDPRLNVIQSDARVFLNNNSAVYDILLVDIFNSACELPFHAITREAVFLMAQALSDDGIVVVNFISALQGDDAGFLRAVKTTFQSVFPVVHIFAIGKPYAPLAAQNIALVALKTPADFVPSSSDPAIDRYLKRYWDAAESLRPGILLSDAYAPVERLLER